VTTQIDITSVLRREGKPNSPEHPTRTTTMLAKEVASINKEKGAHNPQAVVKIPIPEVNEILKSPSSFSFENEIQKIKILVPFL